MSAHSQNMQAAIADLVRDDDDEPPTDEELIADCNRLAERYNLTDEEKATLTLIGSDAIGY